MHVRIVVGFAVAGVACGGIIAACGSPDNSCSGPYAALNAACAGDASTDGANDRSTTGEARADVASDAVKPDAIQDGSVDGEGGCAAPATLDCNGTCIDPSQPAHCGTCTNVCEGPDSGSGAATCTNGVCGLGCSGTTSLNCSGACVDPTEAAHCGSCANACPGPAAGTGTPVCTLGADGGGECSVSCGGATTETCGSSCYAPTDVNHCGSCTKACPAPPSGNGAATCSGTTPACGVKCNTGFHVCTSGTDCLADTDEPSDAADPCVITETLGIFVSPAGSDMATGTQLAPVATIGHAMDLAKAAGKRVYACGSAGSYTENLIVAASRDGLKVYGALDCTTAPSQWTYNAAKVATVAPASGISLAATGLTSGVTFEDFGFVAAGATGAGASSIAVFASGSAGVVLERCSAQSGVGQPGQSFLQQAPAVAASAGQPGNAPTLGPPKEGGTGGMGGSNGSCASTGGLGGSASSASGTPDGGDGTPGPSNGESELACMTAGNPPTSAVTGSNGPDGPGATDWASFTAAGWSPLAGTVGQPGTLGQGGGGGAAGAVGALLGGGGGGGAGGCGGAGGSPGTGGGSSTAVLAFDSTLTLTNCTLVAGNAGAGGGGAAGQRGQAGGDGGVGGAGACGGGQGASGGNGGGGGGGAGGISAGVLWTGTAPTVSGGSQAVGASGPAGSGGNGTACTTAGNNCGKAGTAGPIVQFE